MCSISTRTDLTDHSINAHPRAALHHVPARPCGRYDETGSGSHKRVEIRDWLAANPRVQVHFTPTSGSWLNLVEVWFGIIERQAIHRGSYRSVTDLTRAIRAFIDGWNDRCHPFVWTKTAEQIHTKANRKKTSDAGH
jgi:hypothetical protein